jgi:hypothetical protein
MILADFSGSARTSRAAFGVLAETNFSSIRTRTKSLRLRDAITTRETRALSDPIALSTLLIEIYQHNSLDSRNPLHDLAGLLRH